MIQTNQKMQEKIRIEAISSPHPIEAVSWDENLLSKLTTIIEENIAEPELSVNFLADKLGINSKQVYRKIKQLTGHTPVDYIRSIRIKKAAMLLAQKKFLVAEVMYLVGYYNYSYFSKCFQQKYHMSPRQYMDNIETGKHESYLL